MHLIKLKLFAVFTSMVKLLQVTSAGLVIESPIEKQNLTIFQNISPLHRHFGRQYVTKEDILMTVFLPTDMNRLCDSISNKHILYEELFPKFKGKFSLSTLK